MGESADDRGSVATEHDRAADAIAELSRQPYVVIQDSEVQAEGKTGHTTCSVTFALKKDD